MHERTRHEELLVSGNRRRTDRVNRIGSLTAIAFLGVMSAAFAMVAATTLVACGAQRRPDGGKGLLPVGAAAPDITGRDITGHESQLSKQHGQPAVVYFYPKDATPGCTREACAFRDTWKRFTDQGVQIYGVSRDSAESHAKFLKEHELPFPLVADESGSVSNAYGVPDRMGMSARVSFLVDKQGRIARVWPDVDPAVHADEVLKAVEDLSRVSAN